MACGIIQECTTIEIVPCCVLIMHIYGTCIAINQGSLVIFFC